MCICALRNRVFDGAKIRKFREKCKFYIHYLKKYSNYRAKMYNLLIFLLHLHRNLSKNVH